jgi:signal transduction histidine kinase
LKISIHQKILISTLLAAVVVLGTLGLLVQIELVGSLSFDWLVAPENQKTVRLAAALTLLTIAVAGVLINRVVTTSLEPLLNAKRDQSSQDKALSSNQVWMNYSAAKLERAAITLRTDLESLAQDNNAQRTPSNTMLLDKLRAEILTVERLATELREIAQHKQGSIQRTAIRVDLPELLAESLLGFYQQFNAKGLQISVKRCGSSLVHADPKAMQRVINMLMQAALESAQKQSDVQINCQRTAVAVSVHFHHGHYTCPEEDLALCKSIVEEHGGAFSAYPTQEGGLEALIMLPLVKAA